MAEDKKSAIIYADIIHTIEKLKKMDKGKEKIGELFITILEYINDRNPIPEDPIIEIAFEPIKQQFKRDLKKWDKTGEGKKESGVMGNLKRWHKDLYEQVLSEKITIQAAIFQADERKAASTATVRKTSHTDKNDRERRECDKSIANIAVTDTVTVTVNDTVTDNTKKGNLIDLFFNDLPGSSHFETIARNLFLTKDQLLPFLPKFRAKAELTYPNFDRFASHFKNWVAIELRSQTSPSKKRNQL